MPNRSLDGLVDLLYTAACEPRHWATFLEALSQSLRGAGADLAVVDATERATGIHVGLGIFGTDFQSEYMTSVARLDPYLLRGKSAGWLRTGTVGLGEALIPLREFKNTDFYHAFAKRHDYIGGLSAVVAADDRLTSVVSVGRRMSRGFGTAEVKLMQLLMPHLQRALQVHRRLSESNAREWAFVEALNRMVTGVIMIGGGELVLFANDSAGDILRKCDGLSLDRGLLRAARSDEHASLRLLVRGVAETAGTGSSSGGVLQICRPSGRRALQVTVSPLPSNGGLLGVPRARAVVFITDPDWVPVADVAFMRRIFGLTRMEGEIARALLQDMTVREMGEALGLRDNSVRFHLKHLFAKTHTRRQSELVGALLSVLQLRTQ